MGTLPFDIAVIGGGVMGCGTALHVARGGMRTVLLEKGRLCREASGANAGGMTLQDKPAEMIPYFLEARSLWRSAPDWLGRVNGHVETGGLMLAFREDEEALLENGLKDRQAAGLPVELVGANRARELEPALSHHVVGATYCPWDGYGDSAATGALYGPALRDAGVSVREDTPVSDISPEDSGFAVHTDHGTVRARRLVLAGGVWLRFMGCWFDRPLPVLCDTKQVAVTERGKRLFQRIMRTANQRLSVKQVANGTVILGGGWPARGHPQEDGDALIAESLVGNIRIARHALPGLAGFRLARGWVGLEVFVADRQPILGPLPGWPDVYAIGGFLGGYTVHPSVTRLLARRILEDRETPALFDPGRFHSEQGKNFTTMPAIRSAAGVSMTSG